MAGFLNRLDCLRKISSGDGIKKVNEFFSELESAVEVLTEKFSKHLMYVNVQHLLPLRGIVARALRKIHSKIIPRLCTNPKLANPWAGEFTVDMPGEIFTCIAKDVMDRTNFGHQLSETNSQTIYKIVDVRKASYLFARMALGGFDVNRSSILKKPLNDPERCEVVASEEKPVELISFTKTMRFCVLNFSMVTGTKVGFHSIKNVSKYFK